MAELHRLLEALAAEPVEIILVGGLAAVAQGAPIVTFDIDIVHRRTEANVDALLAFLHAHHAYYRGRPGGQRLAPAKAALMGSGHQLLMTDLGPLDVLGTIEHGLGYDELLADSIALQLGERVVRVLGLRKLIELKRSSRHPKDSQAVPILEATLARLGGAKGAQ
jgi:hypothetical protein